MCEICRQTPCHNMCPNANPPEVTCCKCGNVYYEEEESSEYIEFRGGDIVCNECLRDYCKENFT